MMFTSMMDETMTAILLFAFIDDMIDNMVA